jgi:hypothetical protein
MEKGGETMNKRAILTMAAFTVLVLLFPGFSHGAIPISERAALIALYNSTNGDNWTNNSGWKTPPLHTDGFAMPGTESSWYGVFVSGDHVDKITLNENHLNGTIPSQLDNLSNLKYLSLKNNQLSDSIPAQLGNLKHLEVLSLRENQLSGGIPSELSNLSNLKELILYNNQLSGSIPCELENLGNLEVLDLNNNLLSGSIPAQLGNLSKLVELCLGANQLSGSIPAQLGNLSRLRWLGLSHNQLSGEIPSSLKNVLILKIKYNCLFTTDPMFSFWLDAFDPGWEATQCLNVPEVTTNWISAVTSNSAIGGGNVTSDGGSPVTERGVCWSTVANPTINNPKTSDGSGTGSFTSTITGLSALTTYYVRAYAASGVGTAYGSTMSFSTPSNLPEIDPPFGSFDTPILGSAVAGSIAVTGWALDDGGLESVKIYLTQGDTQIYIGDALFVEGARPDIVTVYPDYPANTKAGWGYMMLTNFLPGGGNGTYVLSAIATDLASKTTLLGTKTIIVDNAHAVKPFGAIDTPGQGGTASGSAFRNWGWVLTPQPNQIPTDGSTIDVWVDSVNLGHPTYNIYRSDVASFFPGLVNSNGPAGYFDFDTTYYSDGLHTISWTATDSGGNTDGIGSRYFTVQNTGNSRVQSTTEENGSAPITGSIDTIPYRFSEPLKFNKGFSADVCWEELLPDENGMCLVVIKELERVEIHLGDSHTGIQGFLLNDSQLNRLPIGSTLDAKAGTFSWSPGPGFLGRYSLVFVLTDANGQPFKKFIHIKIVPKFHGIR